MCHCFSIITFNFVLSLQTDVCDQCLALPIHNTWTIHGLWYTTIDYSQALSYHYCLFEGQEKQACQSEAVHCINSARSSVRK